MLIVAVFGLHDRDELDLAELMLADHAARVSARRTGLGAEARGVGGEAQRQRVLGEDLFAHEIGERDFGRWDEPKIFARRRPIQQFVQKLRRLDLACAFLELFVKPIERLVQEILAAQVSRRGELIVQELRQLARAEHCGILDQDRGVHLRVAVLTCVQIEHELRQCALKPRQRALQHDEARAGKARGGLEIHQAERFAKRHVIGGEIERRRRCAVA